MLLQPQRPQKSYNSSHLMLHPKHARPVFVSYPRYLEQIRWPVLDAGFLLITTRSKIVCSIPHRIFCSGCSEDSKPAHTNSSLSHECASDGSLFLLTPTLVVAICAKVSPCSFSKRPQTPASCPFSSHCCSHLASWRPNSWGRFASAMPSWQ